MASIEARLTTLERKSDARVTWDPATADGYFLYGDPPEESEPVVICNGHGREWRRLAGETAGEFIARAKREARSQRGGMLAAYDRMLRVTETAKEVSDEATEAHDDVAKCKPNQHEDPNHG